METIVTEKVARRAFAKTFVNEKSRILQMVRQAGYPLKDSVSNGELLSAVDRLMQSNQDFAAKMIELITRTTFVSNARSLELVGNSGEVDGLTNMFSPIKGKNAEAISKLIGGASYSTSNRDATIAADPVSAIAGSVGAIFKRTTSFAGRGENTDMAHQEVLQEILRAEQEKPKSPSKLAILLICGGLLATGLLANWKTINLNSKWL